ncbi:MAG: ABC transporter ATP-binding protein, partial [Candidatus Woesearchaeota archaeon]
MKQLISIENLSKIYKVKRKEKVEALKNLNLEIYKGEVFGFLGPNGAGKTTTIKLLMGLIYPTSGCFYINGIKNTSNEYKKYVGYLPENPSFYDYLTGEELLHFVGKIYDMDEDTIFERTEKLLKTLDLYDARNRYIRSYSKGMVQRLGIAQCLLHDPDIYILDEPMSGLDPIGRILVRDIILELKSKDKCVFMSTHILNDIETICDRVGII